MQDCNKIGIKLDLPFNAIRFVDFWSYYYNAGLIQFEKDKKQALSVHEGRKTLNHMWRFIKADSNRSVRWPAVHLCLDCGLCHHDSGLAALNQAQP